MIFRPVFVALDDPFCGIWMVQTEAPETLLVRADFTVTQYLGVFKVSLQYLLQIPETGWMCWRVLQANCSWFRSWRANSDRCCFFLSQAFVSSGERGRGNRLPPISSPESVWNIQQGTRLLNTLHKILPWETCGFACFFLKMETNKCSF